MKNILAILLTVILMATASVTAFAAEYTGPGTPSLDITYNVAPAYTVTIPGSVTIGDIVSLSATGVIVKKGQYISVALAQTNNFTVSTPEGATLQYTVTADGQNVEAGDTILAVYPGETPTGSVDVTFSVDATTIQYAGVYTGTATFTVSVASESP